MYHLFSSTLHLITWGEVTLVVSENKMTIKTPVLTTERLQK